MTREEAIKKLKNLVPKTCKMVDGRLKGGFPNWNSEEGKALEMAIADMEKQIPKKLIKKWDYTRGNYDFHRWTCSKCERDIEDISAEYEYCPYCGQKLDWGEEND